MARTLLDSVKMVLLSCGERPVINTNGNLAQLVIQCLRDAASEIATGNRIEDLRSRVAATSWSLDEATLPTAVNNIQGVYFYSSPTGLPATAYDYPTITVRYVSPEEYERRTLWNYSNTAQAIPYFWTKKTFNVVKVNPYPTDATERAKVLFDVYSIPQIPAADATNWTCSDVITDLIQLRAASMVANRHLQDPTLYQTLMSDYQMIMKKQRVSQGQFPGGYSMYRGGRNRNIGYTRGY